MVRRWRLIWMTSLSFSFDVHRLLVKDLDALSVDLMGGFRVVFLDCGCCLFLVFDQSLPQSSSRLSHGVLYTAVACNVVP